MHVEGTSMSGGQSEATPQGLRALKWKLIGVLNGVGIDRAVVGSASQV